MRKWAYLDKPYKYDDYEVFKVMIYQTANEGVYVFLYDLPEAQICVADEWYETVSDAMRKWNSLALNNCWNEIDDPLPGCQDDCILPIRVKGRNNGAPEWGKYEILVDGTWIAYES